MKKLSTLKTFATRKAGRATLVVKKYSPEILIGVGIVSIIAGTVMCCKATLKVDSILDEHDEKIDHIHKVKKEAEDGKLKTEYTEKDAQKDTTLVYIKTGAKLVKLYTPGVMLTTIGIGCILGSYGIMKKRNVALMAAYEMLDKSFSEYRKRVAEEFGEEKEKDIRYGGKEKTVVKDENGEEVVVDIPNTSNCSPYAKIFDQSCPDWCKTPEYNMMFLKARQNYANDLLHSRGHVFLNEVYDMLGFDHTQAGAVVGWVNDGGKDGYIDFGIFEEVNRRFVNGLEACALLDFNVDGVIYNLI